MILSATENATDTMILKTIRRATGDVTWIATDETTDIYANVHTKVLMRKSSNPGVWDVIMALLYG